MTDLVPTDKPINREAMERIILRAAELQAGERDIGEYLTEKQVMELGTEVGLPGRYLQQALIEEKTRSLAKRENSILTRLVGPARLMAARTVPGDRIEVEEALAHWMTENELLIVKRRFAEGMSWEARRDWFAAVKRFAGFGGARFALSRAKEIKADIRPLEPGWSHVTLSADLTNTRAEYLAAASAPALGGLTVGAVFTILGFAIPAAAVPALGGLIIGAAFATRRREATERVQVALEQVLDKLERREITSPKPIGPPPPPLQLDHLLQSGIETVRKHLRDGKRRPR